MRVDSTSLATMVSSMADLGAKQTSISQQISSGLRITALSDDPSAAGQAIDLANSLQQQDSFLATATTVGNRMQAADTALSSVVTQLTSAVSTAVGAMNSSTTDSARAVAVQQLQAARSSLLSLANSSYGGAYLFSGTSAAQPFTQASDGSITYNGNNDSSSVPLLSGGSVQTSVPGAAIFTSAFNSLNDLVNALSSGPVDASTSSTLVGNLRASLSSVTAQRAVLNTAQSRLSSESDYVTTQETNLKAQQSTLLSANTASLATELSAVTTQRSALLSTIGIVEKGSLFDYIQ